MVLGTFLFVPLLQAPAAYDVCPAWASAKTAGWEGGAGSLWMQLWGWAGQL